MTAAERSRVVDLLLSHWRDPRAVRGSLPTLAERLRRLLPLEAREAPQEHRAAVERLLEETLAADLVVAGLARQSLAPPPPPEQGRAGTIIVAPNNSGWIGGNGSQIGNVTIGGPAGMDSPASPAAAPAPRERIRILFLSANPESLGKLRLDEEVRAVDIALQKGEFRDRFELLQHWAVRPTDLQTCLLRHRPHIVHWSGHGQEGGICLEGEDGGVRAVEGALLARLFRLFEKDLRCTVLNACYSAGQAHALAEAVDCVIGMSDAVGVLAATRFAASFYEALAFGRDVRSAFELGRLEIDLAGLGAGDIPRLVATRGDPSAVVFAS